MQSRHWLYCRTIAKAKCRATCQGFRKFFIRAQRSFLDAL
jgi:hypothetical protein